MIRASALAIALTLCAATPAVAQRPSDTAFCVDDSTFIDRFAHRLGWVQLRQDEFPALIECLVSLDRTNNVELGEFMPRMYAALLKSDPANFVRVMARHPIELEHWLRDLEQAFVWAGNAPSPLESERLQLISLVQAEVEPGNEGVRLRILERLREVRARTID